MYIHPASWLAFASLGNAHLSPHHLCCVSDMLPFPLAALVVQELEQDVADSSALLPGMPAAQGLQKTGSRIPSLLCCGISQSQGSHSVPIVGRQQMLIPGTPYLAEQSGIDAVTLISCSGVSPPGPKTLL